MLQIQDNQSISLLVHDHEATARYHTQRAVLALAKKKLAQSSQKQTLKYLQKELLANKQNAKHQPPAGLSSLAKQLNAVTPKAIDKSAWLDEIIDAGLRIACFSEGLENVRTKVVFEDSISAGAKQWVELAMEIEVALTNGLKQRDTLLNRINKMHATNIKTDNALEDIKAQLYRLFEKNFLRYTSLSQLKQIPRYLRAIDARLDKLGKSHSQETALQKSQNQFNQKTAELDPAGLGLDYVYSLEPKLMEFARMLEEWRVSIFAQHLKTQIPVSEKRLNTFWEKI